MKNIMKVSKKIALTATFAGLFASSNSQTMFNRLYRSVTPTFAKSYFASIKPFKSATTKRTPNPTKKLYYSTFQKQKNTISKIHAEKNENLIKQKFGKELSNNKIKKVVNEILKHEEIENKKNNYVFYHACSTKNQVQKNITNLFYQSKYGKIPKNHYFFNLDDQKINKDLTIEDYPSYIDTWINILNKEGSIDLIQNKVIIKNDKKTLYDNFTKDLNSITDPKYSNRLYFFNNALFGNSNKIGASTFNYFLENNSFKNDKKPSWNFINEYKTKIEKYEKDFLKNHEHGFIHAISIPKKNINQYVAPVKNCGNIDIIKINGIEEKDTEKIISSFKDNPNNLYFSYKNKPRFYNDDYNQYTYDTYIYTDKENFDNLEFGIPEESLNNPYDTNIGRKTFSIENDNSHEKLLTKLKKDIKKNSKHNPENKYSEFVQSLHTAAQIKNVTPQELIFNSKLLRESDNIIKNLTKNNYLRYKYETKMKNY